MKGVRLLKRPPFLGFARLPPAGWEWPKVRRSAEDIARREAWIAGELERLSKEQEARAWAAEWVAMTKRVWGKGWRRRLG
jgi:hypothetical protein